MEAIAALIPLSARGLSKGFYTEQQTESAIRFVFGPDRSALRPRRYRKAARAIRDQASCLVWLADD